MKKATKCKVVGTSTPKEETIINAKDINNVDTENINTASDIDINVENMAEDISNVLNGFNDFVDDNNETSSSNSEFMANEQATTKAKRTILDFMSFLKSNKFKDEVNAMAKEYKVPPKRLATNFITKVLATVGDILGIAVSTVGNVAHNLIDLLSSILHGGVNIVIKVANAIISVGTLNRTNNAA